MEEDLVPGPPPLKLVAPMNSNEEFFKGQDRPQCAAAQEAVTAWYLSIRIGSTDLEMLVDTGAQVSMMSKKVYDEIAGVYRSPLLSMERKVAAANGGLIKVYGRLETEICVDRALYQCEFLVAEMGQLTGLLGMDFLKKHKATLMCSSGVLRLGGSDVLCREGPEGLGGRAVVREPICLLARHVSLVAVNLVTWGKCQGHDLLFEAIPQVSQNLHVMVPRGIVDVNCPDAKVWIANPTGKDICLSQGQLLGELTSVLSNKDSLEEDTLVSAVASKEGPRHKDLPDHLKPLIDPTEGLSSEQRKKLKMVLLKYEHCFEGGQFGLGRTDLAKHEIDTGDHRPFKLPARRLGWAQKRALGEEVDRMLDLGVIEPSSSPWSSPPVLVRKKDGSFFGSV